MSPDPAGDTSSRRAERPLFGAAPDAGAAFAELYGHFWRHGRLDQRLKEVARLRNARLTDCGY